jgi:AbrB family looped-hinge helix DNA binding protein
VTHLTIDKAGRVVIPKALREELRLEPGDSLEMETSGESITLRPV